MEFISETQVTPEEEQEAINLKLPPKFMSYRQLPDCTCETCKKDDEILSELFQKSSPKKQQQQTTSIFGNSNTIFGTPCKPHSFGSGDTSSKFVFGQPFKNTIFGSPAVTTASPTTTTLNTLSKSESLKDMLMKPSVLGNIAANNKSTEKTSESTPPAISKSGSLFSVSEQTKIPSPAMKSFSFTFKTDVPTPPTTNLFPQASSVFGNTTTSDGNIFSNTTSNNLFGGSSNNKTNDSIFGATGNIFGSSTPGNLFATPTTTPAPVGSIFGASSAKNLFFTSSTTTTPTAFISAPVTQETEKTEPKKEEEIVLKCDSNLSFASLAAAAPATQTFGTTTSGGNKSECNIE